MNKARGEVAKALQLLIEAITNEVVPVAVERALSERERRGVVGAQALSAIKAARLARCRKNTVVAAIEAGALRGYRQGRSWTVQVSDIEAWVRAGRPLGSPSGTIT